MIEALDGFIEAGHAVRLAREHLSVLVRPETVVSFDVDQLLDHRSRRPPLIFDADHWESYQPPSLTLELPRDASETPFLLLTGPEPDIQWERFIAAVLIAVERLDVRLTVGLHGVPWAVPHTRAIGITAHGSPRELLTTPPLRIGQVRVPASVGHLLEYRLGQAGRPAIGLAAHVPHYLSNVEYPLASVALLEAAFRATGLTLSLDALRRGRDGGAGRHRRAGCRGRAGADGDPRARGGLRRPARVRGRRDGPRFRPATSWGRPSSASWRNERAGPRRRSGGVGAACESLGGRGPLLRRLEARPTLPVSRAT